MSLVITRGKAELHIPVLIVRRRGKLGDVVINMDTITVPEKWLLAKLKWWAKRRRKKKVSQ